MDGVTENVASSATANTGLGFGIAGTALSLLGGGLGLMNGGRGLLGNGNGANGGDGAFVTRHELDLVQQLQAKDILLASKDSEIALRESESYTDKKMVEVYEALKISENQLRAEVRDNKDQQALINAQQMQWNATNQGVVAAMQQQIQALNGIMTNVVPASKVCETGCCCNG